MAEPAVPRDIQTRLDRGRKKMLADAPKRRLCQRFEKGDTYWYLNDRSGLNFQATTTSVRGGKPPHRIRNTYNFIRPIVEAKVSAATQRIPSFDVLPTGTDPTVIQAAEVAEQVALYGYDQWRLRHVSLKTVKHAIVSGVGYCLPYFDPNVGPYTEVDGEMVGQGEVKHLVLSGNEVYSEPGVDFYESRWYAVERARPLEDIRELPGFVGGELKADASTNDIPSDKDISDNLAIVIEYFERPSPKYPDGRCMTFANGRPIVDYRQISPLATDEWGPYPLQDTDGTVLDEPLIHKLAYTVDPDDALDLGLVWQLIDFQRTIQDIYNKWLEWKNRCLNPQMLAPVGAFPLGTTLDDVPGRIRFFNLVGGVQPKWETPPPVPQALFQLFERTLQDMRDVAADQNIDLAPNLAAKTVQTGIEQNQNRWQSFLGDLAEWWSRVMRHDLLLVARHYTEDRLLQINGRDGWGLQTSFRGAHLMGQTQVRVQPNSLYPQTRQGVQEKLVMIAQTFPGFFTPEAFLAALDSGSTDRITQSYWLDVGRANTIVQKIIDGTALDMPDRSEIDQQTGAPLEVPSWMPTDQDNLAVWKNVIGDFMKTDTYARLDPQRQEIGKLVWAGIEQLELQKAQRQALQQTMMAEQLGMQNAAAPQNGKPLPSQPAPEGL